MPKRVFRVYMIIIVVNVIFFLRFSDVAMIDTVKIVIPGGDDIGLVLHFFAFFIKRTHLKRIRDRLLAFIQFPEPVVIAV